MWTPAPQPHFPSSYRRPISKLATARHVVMPDEARIATYVYIDPESTGPDFSKAILILHGNGEEHGIFGPIIDTMCAAGYTAIALDSRGQGKSSRGSEHLTYELLTRDSLQVLDALGVDRVHALGFSDGGIEALLMARDWPERTRSITALGANLTPEGVVFTPDWDIEGIIEANRAWANYWLEEQDGVDTSLLFPTPDEARTTADLMQLMLDEPHIEVASLATISCPATIMVGEYDLIADYETVSIAQAIPNARLVVVPGAGHGLPKQAPESVSRELLATIQQAT